MKNDANSPPKQAYDIGYGKPPKANRFKPGQSGNPQGRKKGSKSLETIVKNTANRKIQVRTENGLKKITQMQALVEKTMHDALKGDPRARTDMLKFFQHAGLNDQLADEADQRMANLSEEDQAILSRLNESRSSNEYLSQNEVNGPSDHD